VSGAASAIFVVMVNAWMNTPRGVTMVDGHIAAVDPIAGMLNPSTVQQALHMVLAAYAATGIAVAGIHALLLLRGSTRAFHRHALTAALVVGAPAALLQPISGDLSARVVAQTQPVKLAALEGQFDTQRGAPLRIGGWPDSGARRTRFAIEIPYGLSLLAFHDPSATVKGLSDVDAGLWPPILPVHFGFQVMVGLGTAMALVALWSLVVLVRRRDVATNRTLLRALAIITPFGFIATEAGWTVTEVGRQPWVVQGVLRTADAVTPMPGVVVPMVLFTVLYIGLALIVVALMRSMIAQTE
jgi:cytochrome d ubiquinol oxidase subunit I